LKKSKNKEEKEEGNERKPLAKQTNKQTDKTLEIYQKFLTACLGR